jgi:hypothetical protein
MTWRKENSRPYRDSNSDPSVVQPVASHYTDFSIPAPLPVNSTYISRVTFWDIAMRMPLTVSRRFGGTYCLHLQGRGTSKRETSMPQAAAVVSVEEYLLLASWWFLALLVLPLLDHLSTFSIRWKSKSPHRRPL